MRQGSVLGECTAVARLSFDKVRPLITDDGASILLGVDRQMAGLSVGADSSRAAVWMHGSYWYQGEYAFAPRADGTAVTYRIWNISGHPDLIIRLWQRRVLRSQRQDLDTYVAELAGRLQ